MSSITKQELISNLKDKISQFKSNFSKNKESRKDTSDLNFEINRDALKLFCKNKSENPEHVDNPQHQKQQMIEDIYDIKKILNENNPKSYSNKNLIKVEKEDNKNINKNRKINENQVDSGANIKKSFTFGVKESINEERNQSERKNENNQLNKLNDEIKEPLTQKINNINTKVNSAYKIENKNYIYDNNNNINNNNNNNNKNNFEYENYTKYNQNNNIKDNISLGHIALNNNNYNDFNIEGIMKNRKLEKREKSAPKISINQKENNFYTEKPLTGKSNENNIKNINYTSNYNTNNDFNIKKSNTTEELYQKLLVNFNININNNNKKETSFYNFNTKNNINTNYIRENNPNKSFGQINIKDKNLLYEINGNNINNYNLKRNYFRNELNLDHLKDLYSKKTEENQRPSQSGLKSKIDLFYQELNDYKKTNNYKKQVFNNYYTNDKYLNNKFASNTQYNNYIKNSNNKSINYLQNLNINEQLNINKNNVNSGNNLSYNEIHAFKQYLKDLSKEDMNKLPYNVKSELKDIFNLLYQKFNE